MTKHSVTDSEDLGDASRGTFRLDSVSKRLQDAEAVQAAKSSDDGLDASEKPMTSGLGLAFRAASELIAAVIVGVALGLWADSFFDTRPLFLLIMVVICFTAGVLNTWRAVSGYGSAIGYGAYEAPSTALSQNKILAQQNLGKPNTNGRPTAE